MRPLPPVWPLLAPTGLLVGVYLWASAQGQPVGDTAGRVASALGRQWLLVGPVLAAGVLAAGGRGWRWAAVYLWADAHQLALLAAPPVLPLGELRWNWGGKLLAVAGFALTLGAWRGVSARDSGLLLPDRPGWWKLWLAVAAPAVGLRLVLGGPATGSAEALAFQLTMPGLQEEPTFRGLGLALVAFACGPGRAWGGLRWGWPAAVTSLHFGAIHAAQPGSAEVNWGLGVTSAGTGFLLWLVRERSGSVWPAVVLHNLINAGPLLAGRLAG